jgi:hypothetical protein
MAGPIPKTKKAMKKLGRRTVKRVRFFLKKTSSRVKQLPTYMDRVLSSTIRAFTKRGKRHTRRRTHHKRRN